MKRIDALFEDFLKRSMICGTAQELDAALGSTDVFAALQGFPGKPSPALGLYALNRERVTRHLDFLPSEDTLTTELLQAAATRLCLLHLQRIGFLSAVREREGRVDWDVNPTHPFSQSLKSLKAASPALHRFAQFVVELEKAKTVSTEPSSSRQR